MLGKILLLYFCLSVAVSGTYVLILGLLGQIKNEEVWQTWAFGVLLWPLRVFDDFFNALAFFCGDEDTD